MKVNVICNYYINIVLVLVVLFYSILILIFNFLILQIPMYSVMVPVAAVSAGAL